MGRKNQAGRVAAMMMAGLGGIGALAAAELPPPNHGAREFSEAVMLLQAGEFQGALHRLEQACRRGHGPGCTHYAAILMEWAAYSDAYYAHYISIVPKYGEMIWALERGCELGEAYACAQRGYMIRTGTGGPADMAGAMQFYERACALHDMASCQIAEELR